MPDGRLLIMGNLPGPDPRSVGGTTLLSRQIRDFFLETGDPPSDFLQIRRHWKPKFQLLDYAALSFRFPRLIRPYERLLIHASTDLTFTTGPLWIRAAKKAGKTVLYHLAGGSIHRLLDQKPRFFKNYVLDALRRTDALFTETFEMTEYFRNQGIPRVIRMPNSRLLRERPSAERIPSPHKLVFISRVSKKKGVEQLRRIMEALPRHTLDIYGPLDGYTSETLQTIPRTRYKGLLAPERVPAVLAEYGFLLLPTMHDTEGYPGVIIEAFAAGTPPLTYRTGSIPEIIHDGINGRLFEKGDIDGPVEFLKHLDAETYRRLRKGAYQAFDAFDARKNFRRYLEVLNPEKYGK
ncbi:MAG: glycosyltransferase family 4 protein [Chlorobi bacterium]|nr:glycosyltransferase family 4 protein [Chlorobiota bacterium]